jgi:uncharacterized protein
MPVKSYGGLVCVALLVAATGGSLAVETTLPEAVKNRDVARVRALLQQRVDVNAPEADGTTALHWAAHRDDLQTADLLLSAGANPGAANRYGVSPLWAACHNGSAAMVRKLVAAGADPKAATPEGETAVMTAARSGSLETVKVLLDAGGAVDTPEGWRGQTALMWAALEGHHTVVKALIDAGAAVNAVSKGEGKFSALHFAARAGHPRAVDALLGSGADINLPTGDGNTALHLAIVNSHFDLALALIEKGANVRADGPGWTPLHQLLWTRRPSSGRGQPWRIPTGTRDTMEVARALVTRGADVNARTTKDPRDAERHFGNRVGTTPLLHAAKLADAPMMRYLLANGGDPTITAPNGSTLLMWAAGIGIWIVGESAGTNEEALAAVKVALEQPGVDVNATNKDKDTALHGAAYRGANAIVQLLFEKGADLNAKNNNGWTPLVIAEGVFYPNTYNRRPETAELLQSLGAAPSPPDVQRRVQ